MPPQPNLVRIASLKTVDDFRRHINALGIELPCEDEIVPGPNSPLNQPIPRVTINGKSIGNRYAVQPMEGWDGTTSGRITDDVRRRWRRFGESGAKLICGGEAMAVLPEGRANPHQLIISPETEGDLAELIETVTSAHAKRSGNPDDLVIGFQLTHSGRFCKPHDSSRSEPRVAYRHPLLDRKFGVTRDEQVLTDDELGVIVEAYVHAAKVAREAGADFVDIKHCHGYLLHEFLGAFERPGRYGGSFENRTRLLREIVSGIRASGNSIDLAVRLSAFDFVPVSTGPCAVSSRESRGPESGRVHGLPALSLRVRGESTEPDCARPGRNVEVRPTLRGTGDKDPEPHGRFALLQPPHSASGSLPAERRLWTAGGSAGGSCPANSGGPHGA